MCCNVVWKKEEEGNCTNSESQHLLWIGYHSRHVEADGFWSWEVHRAVRVNRRLRAKRLKLDIENKASSITGEAAVKGSICTTCVISQREALLQRQSPSTCLLNKETNKYPKPQKTLQGK